MRFESLPFEVDHFSPRPGRTTSPLAHFLTHAHADHLIGLSQSTTTPIYTTRTTALIAHLRTSAPLSLFRALAPYTRTAIPHTTLHATLLPVFHCPGACMVYVEGPFGRVVHTGDFRVTEGVMDVAEWLKNRGVDAMFVDATYCNPVFKFPGLVEAGAEVVRVACGALKEGKIVWLALDGLGKEELMVRVALRTGRQVVVSAGRYEMLRRVLPRMSGRYLTAVAGEGAYVRVVERWELKRRRVEGTGERRKIVVILASGCTERGGMVLGEDIVRVLYSSHCSFEELEKFVGKVRPGWVGATLESGCYEGEDGIVRDPRVWFGELMRERREEERGRGVVRRGEVCDGGAIGRRMAGLKRARGVDFVEGETAEIDGG